MWRSLLCLFFLLPVAGWAQPRDSVRNLVFEGAGLRGLAYCGVLRGVEESRIQVQRVGGTSAGAITALAVSLGYTAAELQVLIASTPFEKFNDGQYLFAGGFHRLRQRFGWYRGAAFETWLADLILKKTGNPDLTFAELKASGRPDLYICGTSLDEQRSVVFSAETYPQMRVRDAVRISMSIPLYFEAVRLDEGGRIHPYRRGDTTGHLMVDGGFTANFPIRLFDSTKYTGAPGPNVYAFNPQTLGIRIDRQEQVDYDALGAGLAPRKVRNLREYMGAFYSLVMENLNRQGLREEDWNRIVSVSDGGIGSRIRKLSPQQKETLMANGYAAFARRGKDAVTP